MVYEHEMHNLRARAAPATPAKAPTSQLLIGFQSPFASAKLKGPPTKVPKRHEKEKRQEYLRWDYPTQKNVAFAGSNL